MLNVSVLLNQYHRIKFNQGTSLSSRHTTWAMVTQHVSVTPQTKTMQVTESYPQHGTHPLQGTHAGSSAGLGCGDKATSDAEALKPTAMGGHATAADARTVSSLLQEPQQVMVQATALWRTGSGHSTSSRLIHSPCLSCTFTILSIARKFSCCTTLASVWSSICSQLLHCFLGFA